MEAQSEYSHVARTFLATFWAPTRMLRRRLVPKLLRRSSVGSLLRVRRWLGCRFDLAKAVVGWFGRRASKFLLAKISASELRKRFVKSESLVGLVAFVLPLPPTPISPETIIMVTHLGTLTGGTLEKGAESRGSTLQASGSVGWNRL